MPAKRHSTEQIVSKLRQAEVELRRDLRVPVVCKKLGISEQTYYWNAEKLECEAPPPPGQRCVIGARKVEAHQDEERRE